MAHTVTVTTPEGQETIHTFPTYEQALTFAEDFYTSMDTTEARETLVEVAHLSTYTTDPGTVQTHFGLETVNDSWRLAQERGWLVEYEAFQILVPVKAWREASK